MEIDNKEQNGRSNVYFVQRESQSNGIGIAGFVLAVLALFLGWVPFFGWIIWLLGLILSFVGIFRTPKGLAIAGLVISLIGLIIFILLATIFAAALAFR